MLKFKRKFWRQRINVAMCFSVKRSSSGQWYKYIKWNIYNCNYVRNEISVSNIITIEYISFYVPYFPAHKTHRDFFVRSFRKKNNDECILILVIYWEKTGLLHTKISKHNIIYSSQKPRKSSSLPLKSSSWLFSLSQDKDIV